MRKKSREELHHPSFRDVREQIRELGQREVSHGETLERALDAERDLFESVVREIFESDARGVARFGIFAAEDVDEHVDRLRALELAEHRGKPHETKRALVFVVVGERILERVLDEREEQLWIAVDDFDVCATHGSLGVEEGIERVVECGGAVGGGHARARIADGSWEASERSAHYVFVVSRLALPALFATALTTLGAASSASTGERHADSLRRDADERELAPHRAPCAAGSLPDGDACVRFPSGSSEDSADSPALSNAHHDKAGRWVVYDQIPRRPDRPADYDAYRYPIPPGLAGGHYVVSGYDLDKPDDRQRRGATLSHVGHGGVDLPQRKGEPILLLKLEHQEGDADVLFSGPLFGTTVITRHTLREGGQLRDYLLLFGHLDAPAEGLFVGQSLREGGLVGYVGDTSSPELVHLHLEARRVREGIDLRKYSGGMLIQNEVSIVCDPRNVLPLK